MSARPRVRPGLLVRELPGGEVVLTTADGVTAVILNATGQAVVELCDGERSVDAIIRFVLEVAPDAREEQVRVDVTTLLERLTELGLLQLDGREPCGSEGSTA